MYYIGVDLGTSAVKLVLTDDIGNVVATVTKEYPIYFPKTGWSEQNPEDWWSAILKGLEELTNNIDKSNVAAIAFAGQMHGLVILDENDNVIRNCILWNDGRTQTETDYLNSEIGKDRLTELTGNIAFAGFTAPKLLWLYENERDNFNKISKIMLPKDYIAYKLSGVFATDCSDASGTLYFDVKNRCWSSEMLKICRISETQLPKVFESYEAIGNINADIANKLGFNNDVKVIIGAGDNAAAAVAMGTVGKGKCNISLGTSGTIFISDDEYSVDSNNGLHSFSHVKGWHLMGCILSAASCNKWWLEDILGTVDYMSSQKNINKLGENNVYYLPYLMGERSPHNDPRARSAFIGMSMDTKREDMTQAVLEGVAFAIRDCFEIALKLGINISSATICGGGAKSRLWREIIANVLNIPVSTTSCSEGPGFGAAILAMVGSGRYSSVNEAIEAMVKITDTVYPKMEIAEKYNLCYNKFVKIYPALKDIYNNN